MGKDGQPRGNVHEFKAPVHRVDSRRRKDKSFPRRLAIAAVAIPALAAAVAGCGRSGAGTPDIVRVPAASQLPPASAATAADYDNASLALGEVEMASVGDYAQADQALSAIKNQKIATYATAAVDNAEAAAALDAADTLQFSYTDEITVVQTINNLPVRSVRTLAKNALNLLFAGKAIVDAGNFRLIDLGGNPINEKTAKADLAEITDPALRKKAQKGVTLVLHMDTTPAYDLASRFSTQAVKIERVLFSAGNKQAQVIGDKDRAADGF